jgi:SNF2 family DNA or RNA helicase
MDESLNELNLTIKYDSGITYFNFDLNDFKKDNQYLTAKPFTEYKSLLETVISHNLLELELQLFRIGLIIDSVSILSQPIQPMTQRIDIIDLTEYLVLNIDVSKNLFLPLSSIHTDGKNYQISEDSPKSLFIETDIQKPKLDKVRKSYTIKKTRSSVTIKKKSVWDLLFPILQPPIITDFSGQFELYQELYPFQKKGVEFLFDSKSALLADQMGTGKTVQTIVALRLLYRQNKIKSTIVVCPLSVLGSAQLSTLTGKSEGWDGHFYNWAPELSVTVVRGDMETRECDWNTPAHVYLTTYDTVRNDIKNGVIKSDSLNKFDAVVLDEAQYIKNKNAGRSRAIRKFSSKLRWALTGTPIENKIEDLISIFSFIKPDLFKGFELATEDIQSKISPYFLRRLKKDVLKELPDKIREEKWLELEGDQREAYNNALLKGRYELEDLTENENEFRVIRHIFALLQRLKQICNFAPGKYTSPKTDLLLELLESIIENNEKVLVFSQYNEYGINRLESLLKRNRIKYVTLKGGMSDSARNQTLKYFNDDSSIHVFLGAVRTAGLGLNLTEASYVNTF